MNETDKESLSDSTSTSDITTSLGLSIDILSSNSTASSHIGLSSSISSLSSGINWPSGGVALSGGVNWSSAVGSGTSLDETGSDSALTSTWHVGGGVAAFDGVASLHVGGGAARDVLGVGAGHALLVTRGVASLNIAGLDVLALARDVVVSLGVVDDLGLDGQVLNSFPDSLDWLVLDNGLLDFLWNVLDLGLDGVVVSDGSLNWNSFGSGDFLVLDDFSLVWNSLDSFDLVVLNVLLLEWNVFDSGFDWDLLGDDLLGQALANPWVATSTGLESLVDKLVVLGNRAVGGLSSIDDAGSLGVGGVSGAADDLIAGDGGGVDGSVSTSDLVVDASDLLSNLWHGYLI